MGDTEWNEQNYQASVTSGCWSCTPYDAGWEDSDKYGENLPASEELRAIFEEERALDVVPEWAAEITRRMIGNMSMCGHYSFPRPLLQICEAIGQEQCPAFVIGHYTADSDRKTRMAYYVYCLDAWLRDAPLDVARAELRMRDDLGKDWAAIVAAVFETLGEHTEARELCVRRLIHRLRWWIKTLVWFDDKRDRFQLDVYSGDARGSEDISAYGNPPFGDPYFVERNLPMMKALKQQIVETVPGGAKLVDAIESTWLCAPKAFRFVERILIRIGHLGKDGEPDYATSVLQCDDTWPDLDTAAAWYASFRSDLDAWLGGDAGALPELGEITPVKHWLVRILRHKLTLYERHNPFGNLVGARPAGKSGTKAV